MSNPFTSPEEILARELERRKYILAGLRNLPVPQGTKAYEIIWGAVGIIESCQGELATAANHNDVLKDRFVELKARLDCYFGVFGVEVQQ